MTVLPETTNRQRLNDPISHRYPNKGPIYGHYLTSLGRALPLCPRFFRPDPSALVPAPRRRRSMRRALREQRQRILDAFRAALPESNDLSEGQAAGLGVGLLWLCVMWVCGAGANVIFLEFGCFQFRRSPEPIVLCASSHKTGCDPWRLGVPIVHSLRD